MQPRTRREPEPSRRVPALGSFPWTTRNRLARDLHDGVGQSINTLLVQIRVALLQGEAGLEDLRLLEQEAQNALHSVRTLAYGVRRRPPTDPLEDARLYSEQALMASATSLAWIDDRAGRTPLPRKLSRQLACCIRESVTNAARYAAASVVEIRLADNVSHIWVTIRDNGAGFASDEVRPTADGRGLGLLGNAERMREVSGSFHIRSRPGQGTEVSLAAPLAPRRFLAGALLKRPTRSAAARPAIATP